MKNSDLPLTERQTKILRWIVRCWTNGYTPTIREIGTRFSISSPNGVVCHLTALRRKGYLTSRDTGQSIQLTREAMELET